MSGSRGRSRSGHRDSFQSGRGSHMEPPRPSSSIGWDRRRDSWDEYGSRQASRDHRDDSAVRDLRDTGDDHGSRRDSRDAIGHRDSHGGNEHRDSRDAVGHRDSRGENEHRDGMGSRHGHRARALSRSPTFTPPRQARPDPRPCGRCGELGKVSERSFGLPILP